jgi:heme-degrading monooxygenase HmoA
MSFYAIGERWIRPGQTMAFLQAAHAPLRAAMGESGGESFEVYLDRDDGHHVLMVTAWTSQETFQERARSTPWTQLATARQFVSGGHGTYRGYLGLRSVEKLFRPRDVVLAAWFETAPGTGPDWSQPLLDRLKAEPGLAHLRCLRGTEAPEEWLLLVELDAEAWLAAAAATLDGAPADEPRARLTRRFQGTLSAHWGRGQGRLAAESG